MERMCRNLSMVNVKGGWPVANLTTHQLKALLLLRSYRFEVWTTAGPARASVRAHIMSELVNNGERYPQSKSGVTAMRSAFYQLGGIEGECEAHREENFKTWAVQQTRGFKLENYQIVSEVACGY